MTKSIIRGDWSHVAWRYSLSARERVLYTLRHPSAPRTTSREEEALARLATHVAALLASNAEDSLDLAESYFWAFRAGGPEDMPSLREWLVLNYEKALRVKGDRTRSYCPACGYVESHDPNCPRPKGET